MTEHVKTEVVAGIMTLTLARADKKNALSNGRKVGKRARRSRRLPNVASRTFPN